ncbi:MAG: LCP family protein [Chloroflexi bacterium]|nr:LCP family protein [Chloroflexota bacterium]
MMPTSVSETAATSKYLAILRSLVTWTALGLFIAGGFVAGALGMFRFLNLSQDTLPVALISSGLSFGAKPQSDGAPDWRNKERVNILVLGGDRRSDEPSDQPIRTDTIMLVTIDPTSRSAGMLSIPRDLLIPIPLPSKDCSYLPWGNPYGQERINTAFVYGELCGYPTGGAGLTKDTVQYNFGVKVHYYALIDFDAFEQFIDAIGGVEIEVPERLVDNEYPTPDYGIMSIEIPAGRQHLDGEKALWYVRSRHMDSDFGRMHRQQQFLLALREQVLRLGMLPRLPQLALDFRDMAQTDLSPLEIASLLLLVKDIDAEYITNRTLEFPYVTSLTGPDGGSYLLPMRERIRELITKFLADPRLREEGATVEVLNGAGVSGLAARTADRLKERGITEVITGNTDDGKARRVTEIHDLTGKGYTAAVIAGILGVPKDRITSLAAGEQDPDIRVVLGEDLRDR